MFNPHFEFSFPFVVLCMAVKFYFSLVLPDLEGPQPAGSEWADGGPGWEQRLWEKHDGPADPEAL